MNGVPMKPTYEQCLWLPEGLFRSRCLEAAVGRIDPA
jgi:hypothetical protein